MLRFTNRVTVTTWKGGWMEKWGKEDDSLERIDKEVIPLLRSQRKWIFLWLKEHVGQYPAWSGVAVHLQLDPERSHDLKTSAWLNKVLLPHFWFLLFPLLKKIVTDLIQSCTWAVWRVQWESRREMFYKNRIQAASVERKLGTFLPCLNDVFSIR